MKKKNIFLIVLSPFIAIGIFIVFIFSALIYTAYFHPFKVIPELQTARLQKIDVSFIRNSTKQLSYQEIIDSLDMQLPKNINTDHNVHINGISNVHIWNKVEKIVWEKYHENYCQ